MQFQAKKSTISLGIACGFFLLFLIFGSIFSFMAVNQQEPLFDNGSDYILFSIPFGVQLLCSAVALYYYFSFKKDNL